MEDNRECINYTPSGVSISSRNVVDFDPIKEARDHLRDMIRGRCPSRASNTNEMTSSASEVVSWPLSGPARNSNYSYPASIIRSCTPANTLEEIEDSVHPVYLRDRSTLRMFYRETKNRANDKMVSKSRKMSEEIQKWKVKEIDHNGWKRNPVDSKTIYGSAEITNGQSIVPGPRFNAKSTDFLFMQRENTDMKAERGYILRTLPRRLRSPKPLVLSNLIHEYNKPMNGDVEEGSYGNPRHSLSDKKQTLPLGPRVQTIVCTHARETLKPRPHGASRQFCEVLGPSSCNQCIEMVNRRIANDIQRQGLPELDATLTTKIAPNLATLMTRGKSMMAEGPKRKLIKQTTILKLPSVKRRPFGRAGVEKLWEQNAKDQS